MQLGEVGREEEVVGSGRDRAQLVLVNLVRHADRVHLDVGRLRQLGLRQRVGLLDVGRAVGDEDEDLGHAGPGAVRLVEHHLAREPHRTCYVRLAAVDVDAADRAQQRLAIVVRVQVEHHLHVLAELHQADLQVNRCSVSYGSVGTAAASELSDAGKMSISRELRREGRSQ